MEQFSLMKVAKLYERFMHKHFACNWEECWIRWVKSFCFSSCSYNIGALHMWLTYQCKLFYQRTQRPNITKIQMNQIPTCRSDTEDRDELGIACAISVRVRILFLFYSGYYIKARSSSKRKELFLELERGKVANQRMLLIDMPVCWSSTYLMVNRACTLQPVSV